MLLLYNPKSVACNQLHTTTSLKISNIYGMSQLSLTNNSDAFFCRPKTGDSSSDEESKEVSAASCQERLQPVDSQQHPSPYTYRKSLRLSSDQIVSAFLCIFFCFFHSIASVILNILTFNFQGEKKYYTADIYYRDSVKFLFLVFLFCWGLLFRLERPL